MFEGVKDRLDEVVQRVPRSILNGIAILFIFGAGLASGFMLNDKANPQQGGQQYVQTNGDGKVLHQRGVDPRATYVPIGSYHDTKTKLW